MVAPPRVGQRSSPVPRPVRNFNRDEEEPGFFAKAADGVGAVATGAALGFLDDPLVAAGLEIAQKSIPGFSGPDVEAMRDTIAGRPIAKAAKFLTGMVAMFGSFTAAGIATKGLVIGALRLSAKKALAAGIAKSGGQLASVANRAADIGGVSKFNPELINASMSTLERAAMVIGNNTGIAGLVGGEALLDGANATEAAKEAAFAFAIGATFETALVPVGKFFSKRARAHFIDQNEAKKAFDTPRGFQLSPQQQADNTVRFFKERVNEQRTRLHQLLEVDKQIEVLKPGLDDAAAELMTALQKSNGRLTVAEVAAQVGKTEEGVVSTLKGLQKKRFVRKFRDTETAQLDVFNKALLRSKGKLRESVEKQILKDVPATKVGPNRFRTQPKAFETETILIRRDPTELGKKSFREYEKVRQALRLEEANTSAALGLARNPSVNVQTRAANFTHGKARQFYLNSIFKLTGNFDELVGEFGEAGARLMQGLKLADDSATVRMAVNKSLIAPLERRFLKAVNFGTLKSLTKRGSAKRTDLLEDAGHQYEIDPDTVNLSGLRAWADGKGFNGEEVANVFKELRGLISGDLGYNGILKMGGMPPVNLAGKYGTPRNYLHHLNLEDNLDNISPKLENVFRGNPELRNKIIQATRHDPLDEAEILAIAKKLDLDPGSISTIDDLVGRVSPEIMQKATSAGYRNGPSISIQTRMSDFGAFDFNRSIQNLTAKGMREAGFVMERNPFEGSLRYLNAAARRTELGKVIGPRGEVFDQAFLAVAAEGKNMPLAKALTESFLNNPHSRVGFRNASLVVGSLNIASKMTMSVFANMTQPINLLYAFGLHNTLKGFKTVVNTSKRREIAQGMALTYSMLDDIGNVMAEDGLAKGSTRMMAEWTLKYTGFEGVEKWNRVFSGGTGIAVAKDVIIKGAHGKLRGNSLAKARLNASSLGFNLDEAIIKTRKFHPDGNIDKAATSKSIAEWFEVGGVGSDQLIGAAAKDVAGNLIAPITGGRALLDKAGFLAAQQTQFIPSAARRPEFWTHPAGRVMFQFKTFALQQYKFLKDAVLGEAAAGNLVPLATFMAVNPVAGEFVGDVRAWILQRDRPDNDIARYLDNMIVAGAFGIAADMFQSAMRGDFQKLVAGPTFATAGDVAKGTLDMIFKHDPTQLVRTTLQLPVVRTAHRLFTAVTFDGDMITEYLEDFTDPIFGIKTRKDLAEEQTRARALRRANSLRSAR